MALSDPPAQPPLYGRARETRVLDDLLANAKDRGDALVLLGEPGIGKSALLATAIAKARASGFRVLTATGIQSEAELPFAGLHQLMRPTRWDAEALPDPQREAMLAAFGKSSSATPNLFLVGLATLDLLADAAARSPLLIVAEDAQWLDRPTCDVLTFVARRLESDPIILLFAVREDSESAILHSGLNELRLEGLGERDAAAVLDAQAAGLKPDMRRRVLEEARGNPLALIELPLAIRSDNLPNASGLPTLLPLTDRLERTFSSRYLELPAATRVALLVAALDDGFEMLEILNAVGGLRGRPVTVAVLTPAVSARLVDLDQSEMHFRHPLVRSAIRQEASLSDRLAAHAALAAVLDGQPDRQAWHRAASVLGRDERVAGALDEAAARARARGATSISVSALERAANLTPDPGRRAERLLRAAELAYELGNRDLVGSLVRHAESLMPFFTGPVAVACMALVRGLSDTTAMQAPQVRSTVGLARRALDAGDANLAWNLLRLVAQRCFWADPGDEARQIVVSAAEEFSAGRDEPRALGIIAYAAPLERAALVIDGLIRWQAAGAADTEAAQTLCGAATDVGDFALAARFARSAAEGLRTQGRLGHLPRVLVVQAWSAICKGDWSVAVPAADEAARLAVEMGDPIWAAGALAMKAMLAALRGDPDTAMALAHEAEQAVVPIGASFMIAFVQEARGLTALAEGRYAEAYDQLRRMYDRADPAYHRALCCWFAGDFAEAAVHSGHRDVARCMIGELTPLTDQTPSSWIEASMRFAQAQVADDADAERLFLLTLDSASGGWPLQRARHQLAYGAWLRRRHRVAESRTPLRAARDAFDSLGTATWAERARHELRAAGETSRRRTVDSWDQLSPQELQIATMAADGLSNRDIGRNLYLSHRTVGSHLYRVFPKLGITSRAQLGSALVRT